MRSPASDKYKTKNRSRTGVIRAELFGDGTAAAAGITMTGSAPILALCRKLVAAKHDPDQSLAAYRGDTLALRVRSIGKAANLEIDGKGCGFKCRAAVGIGPSIAKSGSASAGHRPKPKPAP